MRLSSIITAILGLGVAGGSVYVARELLDLEPTEAVVQTEQATVVEVIVAGRDIPLGSAIEPQMLTTISWPVDAVPAGVFTDPTLLLPERGGDPRRAKKAISQGELLLEGKISEFGEKVTIVQTLSPGHRAMAIEVSAETAVGGFVTPGDFVDVVLTHGRNADMRAVTILQNVRVVGVDQDSDERSDAPEVARTVTVEVTPQEGQRLALAQQAGTLSLSLRSETLDEDTPLATLRLNDLLQVETVVAEEGEVRPVVAVRRAGVVTESN